MCAFLVKHALNHAEDHSPAFLGAAHLPSASPQHPIELRLVSLKSQVHTYLSLRGSCKPGRTIADTRLAVIILTWKKGGKVFVFFKTIKKGRKKKKGNKKKTRNM